MKWDPKYLHYTSINITHILVKVNFFFSLLFFGSYTEVSYKGSFHVLSKLTTYMAQAQPKINSLFYIILFFSLRSNHAIVEDISLGNSKQYGAEPLKELLKLLPEAEEVRFLELTCTTYLSIALYFWCMGYAVNICLITNRQQYIERVNDIQRVLKTNVLNPSNHICWQSEMHIATLYL